MNKLAIYIAQGDISLEDVFALASKPMIQTLETAMTADELRACAKFIEAARAKMDVMGGYDGRFKLRGLAVAAQPDKLSKLADAFDRGRDDE